RQLGYIEGRNLAVERRFPKRSDKPDDIMREVARLNIDVIVVWAGPLALAAKRATTTVRVVFVGVRGPVERGIVPSLARPGGNLTGISTYPVETLDPKLFEIAKELLPRVSRVAILRSTVDPPGARKRQDDAARALGFELVAIAFSNEEDVANVASAVER